MGLFGTAFWLIIILGALLIVPVLIACWIASRVHPLPTGPWDAQAYEIAMKKQAALGTWIALGLFAIIVLLTLVA